MNFGNTVNHEPGNCTAVPRKFQRDSSWKLLLPHERGDWHSQQGFTKSKFFLTNLIIPFKMLHVIGWHCIFSKSMLDSRLSGAASCWGWYSKGLSQAGKCANGRLRKFCQVLSPEQSFLAMIQAGDWLSRTQMWWTRSCRGFSSILWQHGRSPSAVPVGSGMGLVLLYSLLLSPQLKHSGIPSTERALTYVSPVEGHKHQSCDQGLEHRMYERRKGKGGTFLQGSQSCSLESCLVGREEPVDSSQHRKFFLSVRGKCLWSW